MQLNEIGEDGAEIVERVGPARMAGDHHPLHRGQVPVDLRAQRFQLALESGELAVDVDLPLLAQTLELVDLPFELEERFFELQGVGRRHGRQLAFT